MYLIVGLGNIGLNYKDTRHNIGFMVIDALAKKWRIPLKKVKYFTLFGQGVVEGKDMREDIVLAKPLTYMNLSGRAVKPLMEHFMLPPSHLIVVHDDLDLPTGSIRIKFAGGDAGHKGIRSILSMLDEDFIKVRIGIGKPDTKGKTIDHVLSRFDREEEQFIKEAINKATNAIETIIFKGLSEAQNSFNRR